MSRFAFISWIFLFSFLFQVGCETPGSVTEPIDESKKSVTSVSYTGYGLEKIDVMPLTEFVSSPDAQGRPKINIYVSLLDSFGCQIKSPGTFRFELYEKVERSSEPKGERVIIWPDIDLRDAAANNECWRDFLRAYEFSLDFEPHGGESYILQVTLLCPDGKRLSDEFGLKRTK
jgi:hypothetical protein